VLTLLHYNADVEHRKFIALHRDTQYSREHGVTNTQYVAQLGVCNVILQPQPNLFDVLTRCFSSTPKLTAACPFPRFTGSAYQPRDPARADLMCSSSRDNGKLLGIHHRKSMWLPLGV
jgi:hypothetical protein